MSLLDKAQEDVVRAAVASLTALFGSVQMAVLADRVVVDGLTFTYANGALVMLGYCPVCGLEVPSKPIRRAADIYSMNASFRAARHDCMDV